MPPRNQPLPEATTESARAARKSFYCELCSKGYDRMNLLEAHENSYDHQHRRRLNQLRQVSKDPNAASRARLAEERANEGAGLIGISSTASFVTGPGSAQSDKKKPRFLRPLQQQQQQQQQQSVAATTGKPGPMQITESAPSEESKTKAEEREPTKHAPRPDPAPGTRAALLEGGDKMWEYEDDEVDPNDLPPDAAEWWADAYRPRRGPTGLGDVEFVYGRLQML